ncbi:uncharacterized protein [Mytilus edulis]|uniref:uncharacterized protein n=1 Tax=Mytilus edulis TaxID=6550 RepID=UPI0039EF2489
MADHFIHRARDLWNGRMLMLKNMLQAWLSKNNSTQWAVQFIEFQKNRSYHRVIGQSPCKALFGSEPKVGLECLVPRDLLPGIQTEEDLEIIFEASSVATDNNDSEYPFSEAEHNTDTEIETDKAMSDNDIITGTLLTLKLNRMGMIQQCL